MPCQCIARSGWNNSQCCFCSQYSAGYFIHHTITAHCCHYIACGCGIVGKFNSMACIFSKVNHKKKRRIEILFNTLFYSFPATCARNRVNDKANLLTHALPYRVWQKVKAEYKERLSPVFLQSPML